MRAVVAANKLTIPRWRQPLVPRPQLAAGLDGEHRIALVSAAAGYGKTATLSSWAAEQTEPLAWLSCDPSDAEPMRFMSSLLAAISSRWPGTADDAFVLLERDGTNIYDATVGVANELALVATPGIIVVDDLHLAAASRTVLGAFIDALPDHIRFVAGTRSDPPLSLARSRMRGELLEMRTQDLAFDLGEMTQFFELHGLATEPEELLRLHTLTEGWPAGVQLAIFALQRGVRFETFIDAFATTDRAISDFLVSEVLDRLAPEHAQFLVETSVLDVFDAELCTAVTGVEGAAEIIEQLVAESLFVVPVDERAHRYRYHHLFGAFLRARLASMGNSTLRDAHMRACRALEEQGDTAGALRHCMALGDVQRAGELLRTALRRDLTVSEGADPAIDAVRLWLHEVGATFIDSDPAWVVEFVTELITLTGAVDGPAWLDRVRRAHPEADRELAARIDIAWSEHHQHRGQPSTALRHLRAAADAVGSADERSVPLLPAATARAHIQAGDMESARSVLERSLAEPIGSPVADLVLHPGMVAYVAAAQGELTEAEERAAGSARAADQLGLGTHDSGRIFAGLARLEIHLERHELDRAVDILGDVKRAGEHSHQLMLRCLIRLHEARVARAMGDGVLAGQLLAENRHFYTDPDDAVRQVLDDEEIAQALLWDPSRAGALIADLGDDHVATQVARVRLALLVHDDRLAGELLERLPTPTSRRDKVIREVQCALTLLERDVERANRHLDAALTLGQPERIVRSIVEQGPYVHKLLLSCAPQDAKAKYVEDLLAVTSHMVAPVRATAPKALVEPLSAREVMVLRYLCSRLTYREIAAALYVSVNTLKSHVRSVYRKLGVESRAAAVDVGRRCDLV